MVLDWFLSQPIVAWIEMWISVHKDSTSSSVKWLWCHLKNVSSDATVQDTLSTDTCSVPVDEILSGGSDSNHNISLPWQWLQLENPNQVLATPSSLLQFGLLRCNLVQNYLLLSYQRWNTFVSLKCVPCAKKAPPSTNDCRCFLGIWPPTYLIRGQTTFQPITQNSGTTLYETFVWISWPHTQ